MLTYAHICACMLTYADLRRRETGSIAVWGGGEGSDKSFTTGFTTGFTGFTTGFTSNALFDPLDTHVSHSIYLRYWYKSTNTDAAGACRGVWRMSERTM
jgi:hypothetical protein